MKKSQWHFGPILDWIENRISILIARFLSYYLCQWPDFLPRKWVSNPNAFPRQAALGCCQKKWENIAFAAAWLRSEKAASLTDWNDETKAVSWECSKKKNVLQGPAQCGNPENIPDRRLSSGDQSLQLNELLQSSYVSLQDNDSNFSIAAYFIYDL